MQEKHHLSIDNALIELGQKIAEQAEQINRLKEEKAGLLIYFYFLQYHIRKTLLSGSQIEIDGIEKAYQEKLETIIKENQKTLHDLDSRIQEAANAKNYILLGQLSTRAQTIRDHEAEQRKESEAKKTNDLDALKNKSLSKESKYDKLSTFSLRYSELRNRIDQSKATELALSKELSKTTEKANEKAKNQVLKSEVAAKPKPYRPKIIPVSSQKFFKVLLTPFEWIRRHSEVVKLKGQVSEKEVSELLKEVNKGHLDEVKKLLTSNPNLLYAMGTMVDVTSKEYKDITVLQYAYIVGDLDMCDMVLEQFEKVGDEEMIRTQLNNEVIKAQGGVYTLKETLETYEVYIKNWNVWSRDQLTKHWCKEIGGCQKTWPAWLRYEITEEGKDALWCKNELRGRPRKRYQAHDAINRWTKNGDRLLGDHFGWWRHLHDKISTNESGGLLYGMMTDRDRLNNEEVIIQEYRATLEAKYQLSRCPFEIESGLRQDFGKLSLSAQSPDQEPAPQPNM